MRFSPLHGATSKYLARNAVLEAVEAHHEPSYMLFRAPNTDFYRGRARRRPLRAGASQKEGKGYDIKQLGCLKGGLNGVSGTKSLLEVG